MEHKWNEKGSMERKWNVNGTYMERRWDLNCKKTVLHKLTFYFPIPVTFTFNLRSLEPFSFHWLSIFVPFSFHSRSIVVPFTFHSRLMEPFSFHLRSVLVPFTFHLRSYMSWVCANGVSPRSAAFGAGLCNGRCGAFLSRSLQVCIYTCRMVALENAWLSAAPMEPRHGHNQESAVPRNCWNRIVFAILVRFASRACQNLSASRR